ncbi:4-(cytidine 5'-diphospho)-2-C-methyl-D-erythritol kinase [Jannaschia ovalis]|uniref:4-diphosphocytidyl-2-C-methyl-D-erythritol kinase n=1 Tax=Jannaschia ovalis TaxID=3038773 RepID=A0ABY8LE40_9RHOB|nr:4-(cytidine 5'-diphospho)-2-C-methyl-D-erythritol kinase [Jannaschia sp. GRR-S6-38]WGH79567.1 4-(cytidine 5'-diphospho)-2-C-methyl-D-erythritol kinase [Jannaschia sp. GRR-S6-38]
MTGSVLAPAKVNLTLHVTGRRADGYHLLDSIVAFADLGDRLTVGPGDGLIVTGPFAAGVPTDDGNLIRRALALAGTPRAVALDKRLPHPAGLGGGSSDAAAVLRAVGADLSPEYLLTLGADLPVCMGARAARMRGIGEVVVPVPLPPLAAVLVNPGLAVPTGRVFAGLRTADNPGHDALPEGDAAAWMDWLAAQRNDLEEPALALAPEIAEMLAALRAEGAAVARMSGSGATCFGLWPDRGQAEAAAGRLVRSGWWGRACTLS